MPRVDLRTLSGTLTRTFWGEADTSYTQVDVGALVARREDQRRVLTDETWQLNANLLGPWQSNLGVSVSRNTERLTGQLVVAPARRGGRHHAGDGHESAARRDRHGLMSRATAPALPKPGSHPGGTASDRSAAGTRRVIVGHLSSGLLVSWGLQWVPVQRRARRRRREAGLCRAA